MTVIKYNSITIAIFLTFILFSILCPSNIKASSTYFEDDFNDNNVSDWQVVRNGCSYNSGPAIWQTSTGRYGIKISGSPCVTETIPSSLLIPDNIAYTYQVDMDMVQSTSMDRNLVFKYKDSANWYGLHLIGNALIIQKVVGGVETSEWWYWPGFVANTIYTFRVDMAPGNIDVYINGTLVASESDPPPYFQNTSAGLQASVGAISASEVWFDNFKVTDLLPPPIPHPTTTPTPTSTPTPVPTPTATPRPLVLPTFDLPILYTGRPFATLSDFQTAFWARLNAAFDHYLLTGIHAPFTGASFTPVNCPAGVVGITCYDSHNGTDFSRIGGLDVYSASSGTVLYVSEHDANTCVPNKGGYGCVVIVRHTDAYYSLYAHLSKINVNKNQAVTVSTLLGEMGETGCPGCGVHLHFGVLRRIPKDSALPSTPQLTTLQWKNLLYQMQPTAQKTPSYRPTCSYFLPDGTKLKFVDPTGWRGSITDPWSIQSDGYGCGITSNYLWKFDVGQEQ